jgi:hypothetical protein
MTPMSAKPIPIGTPKQTGLKQKAMHEFRQYVAISLYLAFFFCAVTTYRMVLLKDFQDAYFNYGAALINALVVGKVILIGEYVRLGRKHEDKALLLSSIYKAFLFGLLVFGFHIVEEVIKRSLHGETLRGAFAEVHFDELVDRSLVIFCTFVPLFAFRELRRVLGEERFQQLIFHRSEKPHA